MSEVAVIGGGLAGITAALRCADAGARVTLYESRPRLGGLTHSFRRGDLWIDNGQHVFLRCCTAYQSLLERLGVTELVELQPRLDVPVRSERAAGTARLRRTGLPAPLHLGASLLRYRWLDPVARLRVVAAALALARVDREADRVDRISFGAWLAAHGQEARAIETVWDLIGLPTLNARAADASLALAATVFQIGLLEHADAADIGWSRVPLQRLHGDAAARALGAAGVRLRLRTRVDALLPDGVGWSLGHAAEQERYAAAILAVPPTVAATLLPAGAVDLRDDWAVALGSSPILNLHLVVDRRVLEEPFVAGVDGPLQWIFDRTEQAGLDPAEGQYLAVSLSAADELIGRRSGELRDWALPHLHRLLPRLRTAELKEFFVTREPHATFAPAPGSRELRPGAITALPGLFLAGAWTATGWPATMEGAVRSGEAAATALLAAAQPVAEELAS